MADVGVASVTAGRGVAARERCHALSMGVFGQLGVLQQEERWNVVRRWTSSAAV